MQDPVDTFQGTAQIAVDEIRDLYKLYRGIRVLGHRILAFLDVSYGRLDPVPIGNRVL